MSKPREFWIDMHQRGHILESAPEATFTAYFIHVREVLESDQTRDNESAEIIETLETVLEHALELGYLGDGSTKGMAKVALAQLAKWREGKI